jgi:hypothetical protein
MKVILRSTSRWLANKQKLRRILVNTLYRLPSLDMLLRKWMQRSTHTPAAVDVDEKHLPATARRIRSQLLRRNALR